MTLAKTCATCPSRVPADQVPTVFGKDTGVALCAAHGHVLERAGALGSETINSRLAEAFAANCEDHGKPRPVSVKLRLGPVGPGDTEVIREHFERQARGEEIAPSMKPGTCSGCKHFIPPAVVKKELGWNLAMCAAKGLLLFSADYKIQANGCEYGDVGANRDSTDGITLLPIYERATEDGLTGTYKVSRREVIDPREYPTDLPVGDKAKARGIRAWRLIPDPEGLHEPVKIPVFDCEHWGYDVRETYGDVKPWLYFDHAQLAYDIACEWMISDGTPLLIGHAGVGKTESAYYLAWLMNMPVVRVSVTEASEFGDLFGQKDLIDGETVVTPGRVTVAWESEVVLIIDEPNTARNECWQGFRSMTDNSKQLSLEIMGVRKKVEEMENGLRLMETVVPRNPFCFLMMAVNPPWDPLYRGAQMLSAADTDRLTPIWVDYPPEDVERSIIAERCLADGYEIPIKTLDAVMKISKDLRQAVLEGELPMAWGVRSNVKVALRSRTYSLVKAYKRAITDGIPPEGAEIVHKFVNSYATETITMGSSDVDSPF